MFRLSITILGKGLLDVEIGTPTPPPPEPTSAEREKATDDETPGPVTDRRSAPVSQIGFTAGPRWADGRDRWRSP